MAKDIETKSAVAKVVVHPDAATITREAQVDLPAGASTVVFSGVPFSLFVDSLRASGEAAAAVSIGGLEARSAPAPEKPHDGAVDARLKELRAARQGVEVTLEALKAKLAMIVNYSKAQPFGDADEGKARLDVGAWGAAFDAIGAAHARTGEEIRLATLKAQDIDDEIAGLSRGGAPLQKTGLARDVAVFVTASEAGPVKLVLTYQTGAASWRPAYDARLDTGAKERKPSLDFIRRALVTQRTGEDWTDVALAVSTVGARRAAAAPEVSPLRVAFAEPYYAQAKAAPMAPGAPAGLAASPPVMGRLRTASGPEPTPQPAVEVVADLDATTYAATFNVAGPVNAPGDGAAKSFVLSSRRIEPKLKIRTAPALDPTAYLEASLVNEEEAPLTPGAVTVQRDGVFVGVTHLPLVAPGNSTDFGFGADDRVKVTRVPVKRRENEPGWFGQSKSEAREFKTSVKNLHDFAMSVTVVDQVPFSESSAITVETLSSTTPPTENHPDDKRGVMAWSFNLAPAETKDIHLAYRMKWPADKSIELQRER